MKKTLLSLIISVYLASPVIAIQQIPEPNWDEFCPQSFLNAEYNYDTQTIKSSKSQLALLGALFGPLGLLFTSHNNGKELELYNQEVRYWKARRSSFDNMVLTCKASPIDTQAQCYLKVRELEMLQNSKRDEINLLKEQNRIQAWHNLNSSLENIQTNQNLNNINGNLNSINNKIRYGY